MKILFLAPQPFFEERGTPIAVDLMLRALSRRGEQVTLATYHLGREMHYPGVEIRRIPRIPFIWSVPPSFSFKKVICDLFMLFMVFTLALRRRYDVVHAVEESVYIAMLLKLLFGIPYIYDMDSILSQQMIEWGPRLFKPVRFFLERAERLAIRGASVVVPVCDALWKDIEKYQPGKVMVLNDVSLLAPMDKQETSDLRSELRIDGPMLMYVGNLEVYQGIDLLLHSFQLALQKNPSIHLVVIGGKASDIHHYRQMAGQLGIASGVHFLGPKPVDRLAEYLAQTDILVSPRIKGSNTPMKIYSYLDSGKPLLATNLLTHTQVLDDRVAVLAQPAPASFSAGMLRLVEDPQLRQKLGQAGKTLIAEKHTYPVFLENLYQLYDWLKSEVAAEDGLEKHISSAV